MMRKLLFAASLIIISLVNARADEGQKVISKAQKVTLFLSGAQVTRTAAVSIAPGTTTLVFGDISPDIDVQSLQVKAAGEFTIMSVKHEMNYLNEQAKMSRVEGLHAQQKTLRDKIALQTSLLSINQEEATMLSKNQVVSGENTGLDLIKLKQALDFQTQRLTEIKKKEQAINNEIAALNLELAKYDKQITDILKGSSTATSNVLVTVSSITALQSNFTLTYVVKNAGWYPTYDVRAKNVNSPISIAYKANVSQQCGEDWKNIKLTLSTGNPTVSGSKPELSPYYLNYGMYYAQPVGSITKVTGKVYDRTTGLGLAGVTVKVKGSTIGTITSTSGDYNLQLPPGGAVLEFNYIGFASIDQAVDQPMINIGMTPSSNQLNEVVVTGYAGASANTAQRLEGKASSIQIRGISTQTIPIAVTQAETQTNIEFNITDPYTIPNDGKQYAVEIAEINTPATYQYSVAPKLSTDVFLTARITDWNKYNFLAGEANLFFEGTFIGKSLIDTHATGDTLSLSLGVDKNIAVTRKLQIDLTERQSLGSNKKETRDWLITIKNRKNQAVNLLVEDQVPVSQNSAIEVDTQDISGAEMDKLSGKLSWNLTLNSQAEKQLHVKYQVKYPKNQTVIVQ